MLESVQIFHIRTLTGPKSILMLSNTAFLILILSHPSGIIWHQTMKVNDYVSDDQLLRCSVSQKCHLQY